MPKIPTIFPRPIAQTVSSQTSLCFRRISFAGYWNLLSDHWAGIFHWTAQTHVDPTDPIQGSFAPGRPSTS